MLEDLYSEDMIAGNKLDDDKGQILTPPVIVDYMVRESIAAALENQVKGRPLMVLDPACGTGRFMLGVAEYCWQNDIEFVMWNIDIDEKMFDACRKHALHYKIPAVVILGNALLNEFSKAVSCENGVETEMDVKEATDLFNEIVHKNSGAAIQEKLF